MSFFDDAEAFMKNRPAAVAEDREREALVQYLRREYENATRTEIERALDKLAEREPLPNLPAEVARKVRIWLED